MFRLNRSSRRSRCNLFQPSVLLCDFTHLIPLVRCSILDRSPHHKLPRTMSTRALSNNESFFRYTGGRWLWDEEKQLRERYRLFNVQELQRIAAESVGAQSCISMNKLGEGGYNKVFRLVMDDGSVAIARIPNPNAGPTNLTTASEVATMTFVRCSHLSTLPRLESQLML